jgi:hypothetical protein
LHSQQLIHKILESTFYTKHKSLRNFLFVPAG